ncbi:PilN domain-containing protein [Roseateles sp. PN1]|uniref:PilN domain-containing protein n=1 Tax=Roseateles sp. PN1 TaxID=3137372 RepID=UPI0031398C46
MAQQINLLTPILLAPKRYFSALTMVQAMAMLLAATLALCLWLNLQAQQSKRDFAQAQARGALELQTLTQALAALPPPVDPKLLAQQINQLELYNQAQLLTLNILNGGLAADGYRHSDLLKSLAQTVPASVWLGSLRWMPGQLELNGATLDPVALRTWLERLAGQPLLAGLQLGSVKVEKWGPDGPLGGEANDPAGTAAAPAAWLSPSTPKPRPGLAVWSFRVVSALPAPANKLGAPGASDLKAGTTP